jgi:Protein of unknown function (DUF1566)
MKQKKICEKNYISIIGMLSLFGCAGLLGTVGNALAHNKVVVIPMISSEGKATGDAVVEEVLVGKTFSSDTGIGLTGTMTDNGTFGLTCGSDDQGVTEGYYSGGFLSGDPELEAGNIKDGIDLFGVTGTLTSTITGNAATGDVLSGVSFSSIPAGSATGTMVDNGSFSLTCGSGNQGVTSGYYSGGTLAGDTDLQAGNIRSTATIFGVAGDSNVVNTGSGNAAAADILSTKIAWAGGSEVSGSMTNNGPFSLTCGSGSQGVGSGYYSGGTLAGDTDLQAANIRSTVTIFGVAGDSNVVNTGSGNAAAADILSTKVAWAGGSEVSGSMTNRGSFGLTCGSSSQAVGSGYYSGGSLAGDTNLQSGNIRRSVSIFGVSGDINVVNTASGDAGAGDIVLNKVAWVDGVEVTGTLDATPSSPAEVAKTGQTVSYAVGDDGDLEKGVAWPSPRFTDNEDGTATDNLSGLVWLKQAGCGTFYAGDSTGQNIREWADALAAANALAAPYCLLTDGSVAGDWRLPSVFEIESLRDMSQFDPALPSGHPFTHLPNPIDSWGYWTSTTDASATTYAWTFIYAYGELQSQPKVGFGGAYVWLVKGGN